MSLRCNIDYSDLTDKEIDAIIDRLWAEKWHRFDVKVEQVKEQLAELDRIVNNEVINAEI